MKDTALHGNLDRHIIFFLRFWSFKNNTMYYNASNPKTTSK